MAFKKARKCWVSAPAFDVVVLHDVEVRRAEELTLDHTYRAMTWLGEEIADGRTTTDAIEEDLYRHRQQLFGEVSIAFFDTTSLTSRAPADRRWGQLSHSKDYRAHLKQVVLGMVIDGDDRPFASFLWLATPLT